MGMCCSTDDAKPETDIDMLEPLRMTPGGEAGAQISQLQDTEQRARAPPLKTAAASDTEAKQRAPNIDSDGGTQQPTGAETKPDLSKVESKPETASNPSAAIDSKDVENTDAKQSEPVNANDDNGDVIVPLATSITPAADDDDKHSPAVTVPQLHETAEYDHDQSQVMAAVSSQVNDEPDEPDDDVDQIDVAVETTTTTPEVIPENTANTTELDDEKILETASSALTNQADTELPAEVDPELPVHTETTEEEVDTEQPLESQVSHAQEPLPLQQFAGYDLGTESEILWSKCCMVYNPKMEQLYIEIICANVGHDDDDDGDAHDDGQTQQSWAKDGDRTEWKNLGDDFVDACNKINLAWDQKRIRAFIHAENTNNDLLLDVNDGELQLLLPINDGM